MGAFRIFSRFAELLDIKVTRAATAWLRLNTDGTVSQRTAAETLSDLGAERITEIKSADFTAESNRRYIVTATCTVTLPASPTNGDIIEFVVNAGTMSIVGGSGYEASPVPVIARRASPFWFMQSTVPIATGVSGLGTGVATALAINTGSTGAVALQGGAISATTLTASGAVTASGSGSDSTLKIGAVEAQSLGVNNCWAADNIYYNGSAFKYQASGFGNLIYFTGSGFNFYTAPSGSAGATASLTSRMTVGNDGTVTATAITAGNFTASGTVKTGSYTAAAAIASSHATAVAAGDGAQTYISDTDKPAWSNGTVWKYADGTTVT